MAGGLNKGRAATATGAKRFNTSSRAGGVRSVLHTNFPLALPALALMLVAFALPVALVIARSFWEPRPGLQNYVELLTSTSYRTIFVNTFSTAMIVTGVSLLMGFPLAWLAAVVSRFWSRVILGILVMSMWTSLLTRTFAWMVLLQSTGVINRGLIELGLIREPLALSNNLVGVTIGMTYILLPFIVFPLYATMKSIDPAILRAAVLCGASRLQVFFHVFLPSCLPGIATGALMVFVMSLGYFVTPVLLGSTSNMMVAELIVHLVQSLLNWGLGGAGAFILFVVTLAVYALQLRIFDPLSMARKD